MFEVRIAQQSEWVEALDLFYRHLAEPDRARQVLDGLLTMQHDQRNAEGMWIARNGTDLAGVLRVFWLGGDSVLVLRPVVRDGPTAQACQDLLMARMLAWAENRGCRLAQAFVSPEEEIQAFSNAHFISTTHLLLLRHSLFPLPRPPAVAFQMQPFPEADPELFQETLERTYHGSLDAPELTGLRTVEQVLAGHRQEGRDRPELWRLAWQGERPVGVVLLTQLPDGLIWSLSYMGLVPEARGNRQGDSLAYWALKKASEEGALELWNSVDERNTPARKLYARLGFDEYERRTVLLRTFPKAV